MIKIFTYTPDDPNNLLKEGEMVSGILAHDIKEGVRIEISSNNLSKDFLTSDVVKVYEENDLIFIETKNSTFKVEILDNDILN